ncbi:PEP-CTERM sorting domain-containing protein [Gemmatimonas groenlandica]|uniref:PEP-CTERM sorting domain-containing protein n=1 Tax=Gemmatimonas groenlandica TaxID=2732249 RepID=A0A6M4IT41_9BACT|nr:PEP-CTERM sorting domain-containing protein [Gemmatimonas groenlandica]QJR37820.1 PEP-CTERM sorting domain-containing protein [Gemmatimonas groenlandica]
MKKFHKLGWIAAAMFAAVPAQAHAQLTLLGQSATGLSGGGLGAVATVLTLQSPGSTTAESGCIGPTGVNCGFTDANVQSGQSQLRLVSAFPGLTGSNFRLFLNAAEPTGDNSITVNNAVVRLYSGNTQVFSSVAFTSPLTLNNTLPGTGNYGFLFGLSTTDQALFQAALMANPGATIGVGASLTNVTGGQESFSVGTDAGGGTTSVVPEPSTYLLMASGLVALGMLKRKRRTS